MEENDEIFVEILDDGRIKVTTGEISVANHMSAEKLLETIETLAGGETVAKKRLPFLEQHVHERQRVKH